MGQWKLLAVALVTLFAACSPSQPKPTPVTPAPTVAPTATVPGTPGARPGGRPPQLPPELQNMQLPLSPPGGPTPTPTSATLYRPPAPPTKATTTLDLPAEATGSQRVSPSAPATISLPDGARLQLPAGSVASETTITVKKLAVPGPEAKSSAAYEIGPGDVKLKGKATLVLPFDAAAIPKNVPEAQVKVAVLTPGEGWVEVPAQVDRVAGRATLETDHFSTWLIFWTGTWAAEYNPNRPPVKLQVPYYGQGDSGWCWAASTQMLLKYYGRDMDIWKIAEIFGADYNTGLSGGEFISGFYAGFLETQGFDVERSFLGWQDFNELTGYLMYQVSLGRPVWILAPGVAHAFLVVGFDQQGLYINDSSGYTIEFVRGAKAVNESKLNPTLLTYAEWYRVAFWNPKIPGWDPRKWNLKGFGFIHTLVVKRSAPAQTPAVSMSVLSRAIEFRIPRPSDMASDFENEFRWDGTKRNGHYFDGLLSTFVGLPENNPGNSDTLTKFELRLANSMEREVTASVQLLLDGRPIRDLRSINLPGRTSNIRVDLMEGSPYSFRENPLRPGPHQFQLAMQVGHEVTDMATIHFTMGPAQPTGLRAEWSGDTVRLSWEPNPEEARGLANLVYVVWKDRQNPKMVVGPTFEDRMAPGDTKTHEYRVEALDVSDPSRGWLTSIISEKVVAKPPVPQPLTAKLTGRIYLGATPYQQKTAMNHGLFVISAADGKWRLVSPRAISGVAISPDGTKLAAGMLAETGAGPGDPQLAIFDAKDPAFKLLRGVFKVLPWQTGPQQLTDPTWARDSNTLVVSRVQDLHLYDYAQDKGSRIILENTSIAAWSPTDDRLLVLSNGLKLLDDARKGAYTYDPWTEERIVYQTPRQGAVTTLAGAPSDAWDPEWAPDGRNIVFVSKGVVQVMSASGGSAKALTPADWKARVPVYSPDGAYIAFVRLEPEPNGGVWAMKADGSEPKQVVKTSLANIWRIDLDWGP